jgi:lysozyme
VAVNRERLHKSLILHEGLKLKPYQCTANKLTIGVGRNIEDNGITVDEAMMMLDNDIETCVSELNKRLPGWTEHNEVRQNVLIEMVFNLGAPRLMGFRKMIAALERKDYEQAAKEMLDSRWAVQVGNRARTMAQMMRTGKWPS